MGSDFTPGSYDDQIRQPVPNLNSLYNLTKRSKVDVCYNDDAI